MLHFVIGFLRGALLPNVVTLLILWDFRRCFWLVWLIEGRSDDPWNEKAAAAIGANNGFGNFFYDIISHTVERKIRYGFLAIINAAILGHCVWCKYMETGYPNAEWIRILHDNS